MCMLDLQMLCQEAFAHTSGYICNVLTSFLHSMGALLALRISNLHLKSVYISVHRDAIHGGLCRIKVQLGHAFQLPAEM